MKPISHWVMQYIVATGTLSGILLAVDVSRGATPANAWPSCVAWAAVASALFIGGRYRQARKGHGVPNR
jgi:hypothetical protein